MKDELVPLRFGVHYGTGWIAKLIQWQQRCPCSHISIIANDNLLIEAREFRGVVSERTLAMAREESRVDVLFTMVAATQRDACIAWALSQRGKLYDYSAILRFITRSQSDRADNGKWFCSEFAFVGASKADVILLKRIDPVAVSPGHFLLSPQLSIEST